MATEELNCTCPCFHLRRQPTEDNPLTLEQKIEQIQKEMKIDKRLTTKYQSRLVSAPDHRALSVAIGGVGIAVICCVIGGIALMDLPHLIAAYRNIKLCLTQRD